MNTSLPGFPARLCSVALLHDSAGASGDFLAGLAHPLAGLDHVLAMVAVGIWGAQLGRPAAWMLPIAFPMLMAMGGAAALCGMAMPGVEIGIALSAVVLGLAVAVEWRARLPVAAVIVSALALFHGHAHGSELPEGASGLSYSVGFVLSTGLLHAAGIGLGTLHGRRIGRLLLRIAGALIFVGGSWFLRIALS